MGTKPCPRCGHLHLYLRVGLGLELGGKASKEVASCLSRRKEKKLQAGCSLLKGSIVINTVFLKLTC